MLYVIAFLAGACVSAIFMNWISLRDEEEEEKKEALRIHGIDPATAHNISVSRIAGPIDVR